MNGARPEIRPDVTRSAAGSGSATSGPQRTSWSIGRVTHLPHILLALALLLFAGLGLRLIDVGAGDLSIVGLFSTDEQFAGQLVRSMIAHGNLGLSHFYSYGPLDLYAARLLLWPWSLLRPVSDQAIIVAVRLVSLLAGIGCVAATYALGARLWNQATGALAALALGLNETLLAWSTTAHPDTLQLLWLLLGLLCAVQLASGAKRLSFLLLGSVCAAMAFATKYTGELLLPVLWLTDMIAILHAGRISRRSLNVATIGSWLRDVVLSAAVFAACFLATDPSVLVEPRQFIYQARLEAGLAHSGHLFRLSNGIAGWFATLAGAGVLGPVLLALGLLGLGLWGVTGVRALTALTRGATVAGDFARAQGRLVLALWTAGYLLFLLVWIADRQPRYALPAVPGLCAFAAAALISLARRSRPAAVLALVLALAALAPPAWSAFGYERATAARMNDVAVQQRIEVGRWLAAHVPANTKVVADAYAYLPPELTNVELTFGLTQAQIAADRPQIIVTDSAIRDRFRDPSVASRYVEGAQAYEAIASTYDALEAGELRCYPLLQQFGPESVYGVLPQEPQPDGC